MTGSNALAVLVTVLCTCGAMLAIIGLATGPETGLVLLGLASAAIGTLIAATNTWLSKKRR